MVVDSPAVVDTLVVVVDNPVMLDTLDFDKILRGTPTTLNLISKGHRTFSPSPCPLFFQNFA